ncbi:restriction endonuclease [Devosia sp.]|uniref:restriction endonuclease n=1 Tax=Devosia sp. TaxID=1871048 RepID=UPI0027369A2F|nr:restriction endonuclease [Devosia sp.]MDP2779528.1 restriction endonuclease [Devosia sp.]
MPIVAGIILFFILIWTPQWVWWTAGGLVVAGIAAWIFLKWAEGAEEEKRKKAAEALAEEERNRPLLVGESRADRLSAVYHSRLGSWIPKIAEEYLKHWNAIPAFVPMPSRLPSIRQQMDNVVALKVRQQILPHLPDSLQTGAREVIDRQNAEFRLVFEAPILQQVERLRVAYRDPSMSPIQFEKWCESALRWSGWSTAATKASGDQGADVVATKDGVKVVLQCKLYSRPVGNAAVQEIFAAKAHYGAAGAAVVSNQVYTPAAQQLARSCGVKLLHADDLMNFNSNSWSWDERVGSGPGHA